MSNNSKYPELKPGYVVKTRNGRLYMILPKGDGTLVAVSSDATWLYDSYLWDNGVFPHCECMEVYGYSSYAYNAHRISTASRELLWKRESEKTCDDCIHKPVCNHVGTCEHFMNKV